VKNAFYTCFIEFTFNSSFVIDFSISFLNSCLRLFNSEAHSLENMSIKQQMISPRAKRGMHISASLSFGVYKRNEDQQHIQLFEKLKGTNDSMTILCSWQSHSFNEEVHPQWWAYIRWNNDQISTISINASGIHLYNS
jgi:hypothetical protein